MIQLTTVLLRYILYCGGKLAPGWIFNVAGEIHLFLCVDPRIPVTSRMPGREDHYLRRMAAAMDRLFFGRCIDELKSMPLMTRRLLASLHQLDAHSRASGPLQEKTSMERSLIYWTRFLCYCLNVLHLGETELFKKDWFVLQQGRERAKGNLWEHLQNEDWSEEALEGELLELSASFWKQRLQGDSFASPLWILLVCWGLMEIRGLHIYSFTYALAGIMYVGRALLGEWAIPTDGRARPPTPMGYTLSLLLYSRATVKQTGSWLMVSWSKTNELMYFMGKPIPMDDIRSIVADMTVDAEYLL